MRTKQIAPFEISGIDSLGQGVSKIGDKITFIPKTSPGDTGDAEIFSTKKGVAFGRLKNLKKKSDLRIDPICPHFTQCPSCHFLHLSYDSELKFKKENFLRLFRKIQMPEVEVIGAPERVGYRNRIQLHYSLKSKLIGMRDPQTFEIIPIPHCLIGVSELQKELEYLYHNNNWIKEAPTAPMEGHLEIYWRDNELKKTWNAPYASGGFTQVYQEMNEKLKLRLQEVWEIEGDELLDLFAGNGNLSNNLKYSKRLCADFYTKLPGNDFVNQDLYAKDALTQIQKKLHKENLNPKHLLLDPPRSGLKDISDWIRSLRPNSIAYVSCDPHTLARDLQSIEGYRVEHAFLIDFFPSTFHFETMVILKRIC